MSALAIAAETFTPLTDQCLRTIVEKFSGQEFTIEDLKNDEDLIKFMAPQKGKKKSKAKKASPTERATSDYECHQCDARVWEKGYGGQCSRKKVDGECMCQMHLNHLAKEGKWWLGLMTEPRPEILEHPSGRPHAWKITTEGEEVVKEKKSPKKSSPKASGEKKKPGRPKGSKNKNKEKGGSKDDEIAALNAQLAEVSAKKDDGAGTGIKEEEVVAPVEEPVEESVEEPVVEEKDETSDNDDDFEKIVFEGVEYMMNPEDGCVMNPDDFGMIGVWNAEEEKIDFEGDGEDVHNSKK